MHTLLALLVPMVMAASPASCDELRVTGGNNRFVPATVSFAARATSPVDFYTYYFGDGTSAATTSSDISHTYDVSGTHTVRVNVGTTSCQAIFSLLESPLESQKSGCSNVFIEDGNTHIPGETVHFLVTGFENKSGIKEYKIDFGNGQIKQSDVGAFTLTFPTPGTYTIRGYIKDSKGNEKGGTDACQVPLSITGAPVAVQPETGTPTWLTLLGIASGVSFFIFTRKLYFRH